MCSIGPVARLSLAGTSRLLTIATIALIAAAVAIAPACTLIEPETGERLAQCVDADSNPAVKVSFAKDIRPLIDGSVVGPKPCKNCHYSSGGSKEGLNATGFDLETLGSLRKGGRRTSGDIIVPGSPCKSAIIQKIRGTYEGARMPKGGPYWTPEQTQLFVDWIAEGALGGGLE